MVFDGGGIRSNAIEVEADGVALENLSAHDFVENGFYWDGVVGFVGRYLTVWNVGLYGVYAISSRSGIVEQSFVSGAADAAFYIGECQPCDTVVRSVTARLTAVGYSGTNAGGNLVVEDSLFELDEVGILPNSYDVGLEQPPQRGATFRRNTVRAPGPPRHRGRRRSVASGASASGSSAASATSSRATRSAAARAMASWSCLRSIGTRAGCRRTTGSRATAYRAVPSPTSPSRREAARATASSATPQRCWTRRTSRLPARPTVGVTLSLPRLRSRHRSCSMACRRRRRTSTCRPPLSRRRCPQIGRVISRGLPYRRLCSGSASLVSASCPGTGGREPRTASAHRVVELAPDPARAPHERLAAEHARR